MTTAHEELLALIPSYALGALEGDELRELERHLEEGCDQCDRELLESTLQVEALAESVATEQPSELVKVRLERELDRRQAAATPGTPTSRGPSPWLRAAVFALALVTGWSLWAQLGLRGELEEQRARRDAATQRLARVEAELDRTQAMLHRLARAGGIVSAPDGQNVLLAGLAPTPNAQGRTFVDPATRDAVFYATDLPALTDDRTYQLWFIADGTPVSAGIFDVDDDGSAMVLVEDTAALDQIQLWAVTIEPAGGVPQPTGEMVLKS